jgi:hypothetical protein
MAINAQRATGRIEELGELSVEGLKVDLRSENETLLAQRPRPSR